MSTDPDSRRCAAASGLAPMRLGASLHRARTLSSALCILSACVLAMGGPASAQNAIALRPDGAPDLQGTWTMRTLTPFFRPDGVLTASIEKSDEKLMLDLIMA